MSYSVEVIKKILFYGVLHSMVICCGGGGLSKSPSAASSGIVITLMDSWLVGDRNVKFNLQCSANTQIGYSLDDQPPSNFVGCVDGAFQAELPAAGSYNITIWSDASTLVQSFFVASVVESFVVADPTPIANATFGGNFSDCSLSCNGSTHVLQNGNIVVAQPDDDSIAANAGAVYIFSGANGQLIQTITGDQANDQLGLGIQPLPNGNFIIISSSDDSGLISNVGSVALVDGMTGAEISRIIGDQVNDQLGLTGVDILPNGNYVIRSSFDDNGAISDAGSVILVDGNTGEEISRIEGDQASDLIGVSFKSLSNSYFVVASHFDDDGATADAGSVILIDGSNGAEVSRINGNQANDQLGSGGVTVLENQNYVVVSPMDDNASADLGSAILVSGSTGIEIDRIEGDQANDQLGLNGVVALSNSSFVVASSLDNDGATADAGSAILVNGVSGVEVARVSGDQANERLALNGVVALSNGNYAIASSLDDSALGTVDAGSVILVDGDTGIEISRVEGNQISDQLGSDSVTSLVNGNYVIASALDNSAALADIGSVILVNGSTGAEISRLEGDQANDRLGSAYVLALANGNYILGSPVDDNMAVVDAGSLILANGSSGAEISRISGDQASDSIGLNSSEGATILSNGNVVISSDQDNNEGILNAGSLFVINPDTGALVRSIRGSQANQTLGIEGIIDNPQHQYVVAVDGLFDTAGISKSGRLQLVPYE